jgi:hypothetical protein
MATEWTQLTNIEPKLIQIMHLEAYPTPNFGDDRNGDLDNLNTCNDDSDGDIKSRIMQDNGTAGRKRYKHHDVRV